MFRTALFITAKPLKANKMYFKWMNGKNEVNPDHGILFSTYKI